MIDANYLEHFLLTVLELLAQANHRGDLFKIKNYFIQGD
jgi:hypothetical protein